MLNEKQKQWILSQSGKDLTIKLYKKYLKRQITKDILLESLKYWMGNNKKFRPAKKAGELLDIVGKIFKT